MEIKTRLILRHDSGLYLSWDRDHFPHTPKLSEARRFDTVERVSDFLANSFYRPERPDEYEIVTIKITYELEVEEVERKHESVRSGA